MKTLIRNLLSVVRRFKMAMFLNIIGLSVAFAAFMVILIQVRYEMSFDKCHPTSGRVFRVELNSPGTFAVIQPRAFTERVIHSSPHIKAGTLLNPFIGKMYYSAVVDGEKRGFRENTVTCHADIVDVFDFPIVEGDRNCLQEPDMVIIPESLARNLFGTQSAVGQSLHAEEAIWSKERTDLTIGAVYRDFPGNTQLNNAIYTAIHPDSFKDNFTSSNFICYLLLDDPSSAQLVADNFNETFDFKLVDREGETIRLVPLTDIYYLDRNTSDMSISKSGNQEVTWLLFLIALFIIVIAVINYTNFSMALTPMRIKSINTQKVLGSLDTQLRNALLAESMLFSFISFLIGVGVVWVLSDTQVIPFLDADLSLSTNIPLLIAIGLFSLLLGIIAGLYPARYIVSFPPALVLKGSFGLSSSGRKLRTGLIGLQFVMSIILIVSASLIRLQSDYMRDYSLGFDKDQIILVNMTPDMYSKHHDTYANKLKEHAGIEDVAFSLQPVGTQDTYSTNTITFKEQKIQLFMILCSHNFLDVMGIPVEEGRDFSPSDEKKTGGMSVVFNRHARMQGNMEVGDFLDQQGRSDIIGFTGDVKFSSLRKSSDNIAFMVYEHNIPLSSSYIRVKSGSNIDDVIQHIRQTLKTIDPIYPFEIEFYDTIFGQLYQKEENLRSLISLLSLLAIILSLVGVFGLVVFETQYRRKEIAIRKIHGSTITQILEMLNRQYVYIVLVCFVIAAPVAWYTVSRWLENFAYKTPIHWWVYALSFCIVLLITLATVTFQSWRVATANPVDSIKTE